MNTKNNQRGAALVIGLILLTVVTIVSLSSMTGGSMQERMTSNQNNKAISLMAAEAGASRFVEFVKLTTAPKNLPEDEAGWISAYNSFFNFPEQVGTSEGYFRFEDVSFSHDPSGNGKFEVIINEVIGLSLSSNNDVLAETRLNSLTLNLEFDCDTTPETSGGFPSDAPAAISCIGGACRLQAGAGQGSNQGYGNISGYDHPIPPANCGGNDCWTTPLPENQSNPAVPVVYLDDHTNSQVTIQGGGPHQPFCGLALGGSTGSCGQNKDIAWQPSDYPNDPETNESTAPDTATFFDNAPWMGEDMALQHLQQNHNSWGDSNEPAITYHSTAHPASNWGTGTDDKTANGVLIIDGTQFGNNGTGAFIGLVVIKNCGSLGMGGNFSVYGAVLIDSRGCPSNYDPFAGNGTPNIRYSSDALNQADSLFEGGGEEVCTFDSFSVSSWR